MSSEKNLFQQCMFEFICGKLSFNKSIPILIMKCKMLEVILIQNNNINYEKVY